MNHGSSFQTIAVQGGVSSRIDIAVEEHSFVPFFIAYRLIDSFPFICFKFGFYANITCTWIHFNRMVLTLHALCWKFQYIFKICYCLVSNIYSIFYFCLMGNTLQVNSWSGSLCWIQHNIRLYRNMYSRRSSMTYLVNQITLMTRKKYDSYKHHCNIFKVNCTNIWLDLQTLCVVLQSNSFVIHNVFLLASKCKSSCGVELYLLTVELNFNENLSN